MGGAPPPPLWPPPRSPKRFESAKMKFTKGASVVVGRGAKEKGGGGGGGGLGQHMLTN